MQCLQHGLISSIKPLDRRIYNDSSQKFNTEKQLQNDYTMTRCNYTMTGETVGLHSLIVMDARKYRNIWFRIQFVVERATNRCFF